MTAPEPSARAVMVDVAVLLLMLKETGPVTLEGAVCAGIMPVALGGAVRAGFVRAVKVDGVTVLSATERGLDVARNAEAIIEVGKEATR